MTLKKFIGNLVDSLITNAMKNLSCFLRKITFLVFLLLSINIISQTPQGFNYQAVAHQDDATLSNADLDVEISIIQGTPDAEAVFSESHEVTTNIQGLFNLVIGDGTPILSSIDNIDWSLGSYFLSVKFKKSTDTNFPSPDVVMLQSVPYAMFAQSTNGIGWERSADTVYTLTNVAIGTMDAGGSGLAVKGSDVNSEKPLFEVKREDGIPVFAVYNDGVIVYVNEDAKGVKGGFAVGGYNATKKGPSDEYMRVTPDSVRIYINDNPAKGVKGGFAVGGYNSNKNAPGKEYLRVTDDSTRVYVDEEGVKGVKGGFAVGGYNAGKAVPRDFMSLTPENYFIGHESGSSVSTGKYNSFFGYQSGRSNTTGYHNVFMGYKSGYYTTTGYNNILIGDYAGFNTTSGYDNIFIGNTSGYYNVDGDYNTYIGYQSGYYGGYQVTDPSYNTYIGYQTGRNNRSGAYNTYIGHKAGYSASSASGNNNVMVGESAGLNNLSGDNNIFVGKSAGQNNSIGDYNVIVGTYAGQSNNGHYNVFIGYESGMNNVSGADSRFSKWNTFIGYQSGKGNTTGWQNIAIGYQAGLNNKSATNQFFIGNSSGASLVDGYGNTYVGHSSGQSSTDASYNTFIGYFTGSDNTTGSNNTFLGYAAGASNTTSSGNVMIGDYAGQNVTGSNNTIIGAGAAYYATGSGNIFIGKSAGNNESGSNKLYIENSSSSSPLIYGDFSANFVKITNRLGVGVNPISTFAVAGLVGTTSGSYLRIYNDQVYYYSSSRETKTNIHPFIEEFTKILQAQPVKFTDKTSGEENIGFIAEDFDDMGLNDLVIYENGKPKSLSYELISLYNLEIIKMQQQTIQEKEIEIEALKERLSKIEALLEME